MSEEILEAFAAETAEILEAVEAAVADLEAGAPDAVDRLFRQVHTLKGSAGIVGMELAELFAHAWENRLGRIRSGESRPGPETADALLGCRDRFAAIVSARQQVIAVTPYFVPTRDLIQALRSAARRGVTVKLVVPRYNNHVYAGLAGRALYEDLLEAGARVFERERPFLHAKVLLIDNVLAIVGTANLDARSLRLNYETNLAVHDQRLVYGLHNAVAEELSHSAEINLRAWRRRPLRQKLLENFCGLLTPAL